MTKVFSRWMCKVEITESRLLEAVREMESGLVDADLGGSVYKKRIALSGQGKRGGARTIVAVKFQERCFFLYGFAKNERENITPQELKAMKRIAADLLGASDTEICKSLKDGFLKEVYQ